ncbi:MAG: PepSY domain-containing protein [Pseudomonadales bacterium]
MSATAAQQNIPKDLNVYSILTYRIAHFIASICLPILFLAASDCSADKSTSLNSTQIIEKLKQKFGGKFVSFNMPRNDQFYQVRWLTSNGQVILLTIDPHSGKILEQRESNPVLKTTVLKTTVASEIR